MNVVGLKLNQMGGCLYYRVNLYTRVLTKQNRSDKVEIQ